jgi:hypothetical protein
MVQLLHTCMIANEFGNFKELFQEIPNATKLSKCFTRNHAKTIFFIRLII